MSYTEDIYPPAIVAECSIMHCKHKRYARMVAGVLCRDVAPQRCYEETT